MKKIVITGVLITACVIVVALLGVMNLNSTQASSLPLELVVSADTAGWIVPCGCTSNQSGGMLRRGTFLKQLREKAEIIYLDVGGAASGTSEYDQAKFEAILQGEQKAQAKAHNIGAAELAFGADYLRKVHAKQQVPLISTNLFDEKDQPLTKQFVVIPTSKLRLLILGVISPRYLNANANAKANSNSDKGVTIRDPRDSILSVLKQNQNQYDAAVVLAYLNEAELQQLAEQLPEVDLVLGGPTGQSILPRRIGPTLMGAATNKGKYLLHLQAPTKEETQWSGTVVEMDDQVADDSIQQANLTTFYERLGEADYSANQTSFVSQLEHHSQQAYQVAGTQECRQCHTQDCSGWDETAHAHAWQTLTTTGAQVDSYCQQCHTTGFGLSGGFVSAKRSPQFVQVGCESCHGPSNAHVKMPSIHTAFFARAKDQCVRCHDRENSPEFEYETYWPEIEHGMTANTKSNSE